MCWPDSAVAMGAVWEAGGESRDGRGPRALEPVGTRLDLLGRARLLLERWRRRLPLWRPLRRLRDRGSCSGGSGSGRLRNNSAVEGRRCSSHGGWCRLLGRGATLLDGPPWLRTGAGGRACALGFRTSDRARSCLSSSSSRASSATGLGCANISFTAVSVSSPPNMWAALTWWLTGVASARALPLPWTLGLGLPGVGLPGVGLALPGLLVPAGPTEDMVRLQYPPPLSPKMQN